MHIKLLNNPIVQTLIAVVAILLVGICIFPEAFPSFSTLTNYASIIMLALLVAGILFLGLKQATLTFIYFGACVILSIFLKYSIQNDSLERWRETAVKENGTFFKNQSSRPFTIAHFNTTNFSNTELAMKLIRETEADMLSFHEINPFWNRWLGDSLSEIFPFSHSMVDIGLFGQAIYSCYPFEQMDTLFFESIPMLKGKVQVDGNELSFISIHTEPAISKGGRQRLRKHLDFVVNIIKEAENPAIIIGDFNCVSWANEFRDFKTKAGLLESRSGFLPYSSTGLGSFFEMPIDHILYTPTLQCAGFQNLSCQTELKGLGISGTFLFRKKTNNVSKAGK